MNNKHNGKFAVRQNFLKTAISLLLAFVLCFGGAVSVSASAIIGPIQSANIAAVESILDFYKSDTNIKYTVADQKTLKSLSNGDDAYTLYRLSPYGYAIFLNEPLTLMQACFTEDAVMPVSVDNDTVYYYGGPMEYYTKVGDRYNHVSEEYSIAVADLTNANISEANVRTLLENRASEKSGTLMLNSSSALTKVFAGGVYFAHLKNYGYNSQGTCTVIAACMLLRYYDYEGYDNNFVATQYESGTGTTDDFHLYMNTLVYGTATPSNGAIYIHGIDSAIEDYLENQGVLASFSYAYYVFPSNMVSPVIAKITSGHPVIASMSRDQGAGQNHSVVVYGVAYDASDPVNTAMYTVHLGQNPGTLEGTVEEYNALWFYEYGYLIV